MAKRRRSSGRRVLFAKRRTSRSSSGAVGGVLKAAAFGAVGAAVAGVVSGMIPIVNGLSAGIRTVLVLGLAYLLGFKHAIVRNGLVVAGAVLALGYIGPMMSGMIPNGAAVAWT